MSKLAFANTVLTKKPNEVFNKTLSYNDLKQAGFRFQHVSKSKDGTGHRIIAEIAGNVICIPCGKSVTDETRTQDCMFGVTKDNNLIAYTNASAWIED